MAVCGLPNPNRRHAEIMARFAAECVEKMSVLTAELAETMGSDTKDLDLRAGYHSGPTTAG
jgi:class 3 adenylate cyclase